MSKYRFKTEKEFKDDDLWEYDCGAPVRWCVDGKMNKYMGQSIRNEYNYNLDKSDGFKMDTWFFGPGDCILIQKEIELTIEEILEQIKLNNQNSLIKKEKTMKNSNTQAEVSTLKEKFVFMDKTEQILNIGFETRKNIVLYGPGE